jgi:hypothetical protein
MRETIHLCLLCDPKFRWKHLRVALWTQVRGLLRITLLLHCQPPATVRASRDFPATTRYETLRLCKRELLFHLQQKRNHINEERTHVIGRGVLRGCGILRIPYSLHNHLTHGGDVVNLTHRSRSTSQKHFYFCLCYWSGGIRLIHNAQYMLVIFH